MYSHLRDTLVKMTWFMDVGVDEVRRYISIYKVKISPGNFTCEAQQILE